MKIGFNAKYGYNEIDIPVNDGKTLYPLSGKGLSNLNNEVFTIINQIPQAPNITTKVRWKKHTLSLCDKKDGVFDKSDGTMVYKANSFTAFVYDWEGYKPPHWLDGGYYAMADVDKEGYYTASVGDLIVFADIPDEAPANASEFVSLTQKYKSLGGIISGVNVYINHKPNGEPWRTNHIELIKE